MGKPCTNCLHLFFAFGKIYNVTTFQRYIPRHSKAVIHKSPKDAWRRKQDLYRLLLHREELENCAEKIIYTGEIDRFFNYQLGALEWRSLRFEDEIIDMPDYQGNAVVNYTEYEIPYTRIAEHQHFEPGIKHKKTSITKEYSQKWKQGDDPYYPLNDERNTALYADYIKLAEQRGNIYFCGRLGGYAYYNMDTIVEKALQFVESLLNK